MEPTTNLSHWELAQTAFIRSYLHQAWVLEVAGTSVSSVFLSVRANRMGIGRKPREQVTASRHWPQRSLLSQVLAERGGSVELH